MEVDVDELNSEQVLEINKMASTYGMADGDFVWSVHYQQFLSPGSLVLHLLMFLCPDTSDITT